MQLSCGVASDQVRMQLVLTALVRCLVWHPWSLCLWSGRVWTGQGHLYLQCKGRQILISAILSSSSAGLSVKNGKVHPYVTVFQTCRISKVLRNLCMCTKEQMRCIANLNDIESKKLNTILFLYFFISRVPTKPMHFSVYKCGAHFKGNNQC